jgi:type IV fimbrial biogenesis protein FimT
MRAAAARSQAGISLVEIAVVLTIAAILITQAVPMFGAWIRNSQIRTATESLQNGLQLARAEAIRRNRSVQLTLTDVPSSGWSVGCVNVVDTGTADVEDPGDCLAVIQSRNAIGDGTEGPQIAVTPTNARLVTFDSIGRITVNVDGTPTPTQLDATDPALATADMRALRVTIGLGGDVRMCDPALSGTDPRRCP